MILMQIIIAILIPKCKKLYVSFFFERTICNDALNAKTDPTISKTINTHNMIKYVFSSLLFPVANPQQARMDIDDRMIPEAIIVPKAISNFCITASSYSSLISSV